MLIYVMNDIFDATPNNCIIVQQVNCKGKMGAGLALEIRKRYPDVYDQYMTDYHLGLLELGHISYVLVNDNLMFASMCAQDAYGTDRQYTSYDALESCLSEVKEMAKGMDMNVVIPKGIGSGLAGGNADTISRIIEDIFGQDDEVHYVYSSAEKYERMGQ